MSQGPDELDEEGHSALLRWRLALGPDGENPSEAFALDALRSRAPSVGLEPTQLDELDAALSFVYADKTEGTAESRPFLPAWLSALREFFRHEVVAFVQKDAIDSKHLGELLLEPETLPLLEKNVALVATLLSAKGLVPDRARETARGIVREVAEELRQRLSTEVRTVVGSALRRRRATSTALSRNVDFRRTIEKNLKGWDPEKKRLFLDHLYVHPADRLRHDWDLTLLVDQSSSMAESVVYASVLSAIFASVDALRTRLIFFDTDVVDVTPLLSDPVDVLFASQLGGGTDINRAVAYAEEHLIDRPAKTILVLVSDLFEGGDRRALLSRLARLVQRDVKVLCLLSLSDAGEPNFDAALAAQVQALGVPAFGCSPSLLPDVVSRILSGESLPFSAFRATFHD